MHFFAAAVTSRAALSQGVSVLGIDSVELLHDELRARLTRSQSIFDSAGHTLSDALTTLENGMSGRFFDLDAVDFLVKNDEEFAVSSARNASAENNPSSAVTKMLRGLRWKNPRAETNHSAPAPAKQANQHAVPAHEERGTHCRDNKKPRRF